MDAIPNFPLLNPYQSGVVGEYGAFVTKLELGPAPVNQGVTPNSGGGASQTFGFQFSTPGGITNLTTASVLFNSTPNVASGCSVIYIPATNTLSLLTDSGSPPAGSITPGSGTQQNSQCILNGVGSSVSAADNILTLNLAISFLPPMAGAPNYIHAIRQLELRDGLAIQWNLDGPRNDRQPSNQSWLPGASVVFQWTGMGTFSACSLSVSGIEAGGTDIFNGALGAGTSQLVTGLPLEVPYVYVRIGSKTALGWLYVDYTYITAISLPGD